MSTNALRSGVERRARRRLGVLLELAFQSRLLAAVTGRSRVVCIGDSHSKIMKRVRTPNCRFRVVSVKGATASGIGNRASETKAREIFDRRLAQVRPWQHILVSLGEVDCGCAIWRRAGRESLTVESQMESTLDAYEGFLIDVLARPAAGVHVLSIPLPAIDVPVEGVVSRARLEVTASQRERTDLTIEFNEALSARCRRLGVDFIDVTDGLLDPATRLIRREFLKPLVNQHLNPEQYANLIGRHLAVDEAFGRRPGRGPSRSAGPSPEPERELSA